MILLLIALLLSASLAVSTGRAADWQWSVEMKGGVSPAGAGAVARSFMLQP